MPIISGKFLSKFTILKAGKKVFSLRNNVNVQSLQKKKPSKNSTLNETQIQAELKNKVAYMKKQNSQLT